jgi:V8-like Glu-specific endopeptidase
MDLNMIGQNSSAEGQNREIVLLTDERKRVKHTSHPPFCWICSLEVEFPEPVLYPLSTLENPGHDWLDLQPIVRGCGSGLLVTPKHVLTAAHVIAGLKLVSDGKTGKKKFQLVSAKKVIVFPGRNEHNGANTTPFGAFASHWMRISPGFRMGMELKRAKMTQAHIRNVLPHDFGVVELPPQQDHERLPFALPGHLVTCWSEQSEDFMTPVDATFHQRLWGMKVNIAGYPGEKSSIPCGTPWQSYGKVVDTFPKINGKVLNLMLYQADTSAGMSGSPVWIKHKDGQRYLVGVHSSFFRYIDAKTEKRMTANVAALITHKLITQLRKWGVSNSRLF